tara:strand:- start:8464 stop:12123 length:3660 start_codon:yes stop_codon:yes gene_type:complete
MVLFQALAWEARDVDDEYLISIFGRTAEGKSACVTTPFKPYFFVKVPPRTGDSFLFQKIQDACDGAAENYELIKSKDLWGFQNNTEFPFMKLNFATLENMKKCDRKLSRPLKGDTYTMKVYESNVEPMLRLMHRSGIQSTGWLDSGDMCVRSHLAKVDIDLFCNDWKTLRSVSKDGNAPFVVASFDIETYSSTGKFPEADIEGDCCFQIAFTLKHLGDDEIYDKTCLCYKQTDTDLEGCNIVNYDTEHDLIMGFKEYLFKHDIDIMTGWNIFGFDLEYIYKRAILCKCPPTFFELGKLKNTRCDFVYKKLSSSALGDNLMKLLPMSGRYIFDLFHEVKREKKLDSYRLDFVAETYLGDHKIDMSPKEMFARFREENPTKLKDVAEYCIKDTILPHRILDKLCILLNLVEMAKATWVPLSYLSERGQQIKVFSQMTRKARELRYMIPTIRWGKVVSDPYEGATVLEAQAGAYYRPITALDFASLYPSIMMAHNLCYSTLVMDPKYENVPGVEYESFSIGERTYKFAQNVDSLLPSVLKELKQFRSQAKKDMAKSTGMMKDVYNGKQLAYKISMNSVYGFTGAGKGMLPCVPIASTVTSKGRSMIEDTKNYVEANFEGANVRYGDSVTGDTPLLIKMRDGSIHTRRIDDLTHEYHASDDGKESFPGDYNVWTEKGFTPVERVIRHKTTKKMYRVLTHTGIVDCTEDHSLLDQGATMIKPSDVTIGTKLLHGDTVEAFDCIDMTIDADEAKVMGFFFGDGSCGKYGNKFTWALNNSNPDYLLEMQGLCSFDTKIYDTLDSSGVYKLNACGDVKAVSTRYRNLFYNESKEKVVPSCILNAPIEVVKAFVDGYYMADGDKDARGYTRMDCKGKQGTMGLQLLGRRLGYNVSLNTRSDKMNVFRQTWTKLTQRKHPDGIKKIEYLGETEQYVYDLTTESHHFHVGPGELIVHNTDSVMVEFDTTGMSKEEALEHSWKLGEQAAEQCTALFKKPNDLELEKVYYPYFLYSKKRYAAKLWTKDKDGTMHMDCIDVKGLQVVRRDNTLNVREVCTELLDIILESNNPDAAIALARQRAAELVGGEVPMEKLILSQKLADSYKNNNMAHVQVRNKMRDREPGSEPQSGDRVQYVLTDTGDAKAKAYEKSEDPKYARDNGVPLDYQYYLQNKFMNPVCDLLEPLISNPKEEIFSSMLPKKRTRKVKGATEIEGSIKNMFKKFEQSISKDK